MSGANLETADNRGFTPLMNAAHFDKPRTVRALLDLGANPEASDDNNMTAFDLTEDFDILTMLIENEENC